MIDTFKHKGARERLANSLPKKGITDENVIQAIRTIPRHWFVESALNDSAYEDRALPIAENQTISQPYTVAFQTQLLDLKPGMKILEIGTGSGYQCAILCQMGMKVYTVELNRKLFEKARSVLAELDCSPAAMLCGDGSLGWEKYQPYDRILVTAACPDIPEALRRQLGNGGKLVLPLGNLDIQEMCIVTKKSAHEFDIQRLDTFKFVPLKGKHGFS